MPGRIPFMGWITAFEAQELIVVALDLGEHPGAVRAECVARCPLGIVMPVPALVFGANRRWAGLKDGGDLILTVPGGPQPHGDHGVHARQVNPVALVARSDVAVVSLVGMGRGRSARRSR